MSKDTLADSDNAPIYVSAAASDIGRMRPSNQDAFLELPKAGLWCVADGMGGYRDGDVASRMVCDALRSMSGSGDLEEAIDELRQRMSDVNARLHGAAVRDRNPIVSGSTVAMFIARGKACAALWAGDSRVYRLRGGQLVRLTSDHTWAAELEMDVSPDDMADHVLTRAVGGESVLLLDVRRDRVQPRDRYLLCSDGLTRELDDARIASILKSAHDVRACAKALIDAALDAGGRDNVTVVVIEAGEGSAGKRRAKRRSGKSGRSRK
ncbi:MAG TPA: protein phosphatase 2C domain-containing protein [Steroidobacteraceae bacterium]